MSRWISGQRRHHAEVDVEAVLHLLDQPPGLGEQVLRVEQDDVCSRVGADGEVGEHGILEARRDRYVVDAVRVERPAQHLVGVQLLDVVGGLEQAHAGILPNYD